MIIPLINPCGTKRRKKNPIVFKPGQEDIMVAFKKYASRTLRSGKRSRRLLRAHKAGHILRNASPKEVIIRGGDMISYLKLRRSGYQTMWSGEGKIAMVKRPGQKTVKLPVIKSLKMEKTKRPAARRGLSNRTRITSNSKESSMVYSLKRRPRKHRRARHNPIFGRSTLGTFLPGPKHKRRIKTARYRRSGKIRLGAHRAKLMYTSRGWHRPRRSTLFRKPTKINPRRTSRRRSYRRNPMPKLPFQLDRVAMGGLKIAGGIAIGMLGMPVLVKFMPTDVTIKYRKYFGLIHVVVGAVAAATIRKQLVRDLALTVAGVGVYDLIASNLPMLGLPAVSNTTPLLALDAAQAAALATGGVHGDEPGVIGMEADFAPALGSSYQTMGASYGTDDIAYGGDTDSTDC